MSGTEDARPKPGLVERLRRSLSAKLLLLTVLFVLLAEVLVLIPSVSHERINWLTQRIEAAYLVGLALEGPDEEMIDPNLVGQLFATANILGVTVERDDASMLIYAPDVGQDNVPPMHYIDLREGNVISTIGDAWATVFSRGDDMVRVIGEPTYAQGAPVGIIIAQRALRSDLRSYALNILGISLVISTLTAGLVYFTLDLMIVRPVRRLTMNMAQFHDNPEDPRNIVTPSQRLDEIGVAERSLSDLEQSIHGLLSQRRRLAALGAGVSKISHDLRNILASAQLMSDRLAKSDDPRVRKLSPRLIQSLDRAISLSRDTLNYSRMEPATLVKSRFPLRELVEEVFSDTATPGISLLNDAPADIHIIADRNQFYRALSNLVRNAIDAHAPALEGGEENPQNARKVVVRTRAEDSLVAVDVIDNGPGVPHEAQAHLFEPFRGSSKPGGSGLGIAIAYEILRAHGGSLALTESTSNGAIFTLTIPNA
ncbi:MAG: HAMP domain-containing sensor histidine kinase [Parvularculaceae bacterium]